MVRELLSSAPEVDYVARNIVRSIVLILPLVALTGSVGSAKDNVEIRLTGRFFAEPATVQLVVAVEPNAENRTLRVEADGDNMFCATEIQLQGAREQRLHTVEFKNLSAGGYTLRAQVMSNSNVRSQAEQEIMVAGDGAETGGW
ncbi:MAG TPA: hypothetical protein VN654_18985 [Vicinamibacterales bacterium]|nr:hypothetical protein [Vicinamibacterales bacterium]